MPRLQLQARHALNAQNSNNRVMLYELSICYEALNLETKSALKGCLNVNTSL